MYDHTYANRPKFSIFTPTNNVKYLPDSWASLKQQTEDFEWIIVLNGEALKQKNNFIVKDERVKVFYFEENTDHIGALKKYACDRCSGHWLVELDHDDILTTDALSVIAEHITEYPNIKFFYSNTINFREDEKMPQIYGKEFGWQHNIYELDNKKVVEHISFEPHPVAVTKIWYQPNHVRVWNKDIYNKVGGFNPEMEVLDDQDLISRTYKETDFFHINRPLYFYRITDSNTWLKKNKLIQDNVLPIYRTHILDCAKAWCKRNNLEMLDLGGRFNSAKDFKTVDLKDADIIADLNEVWPFEDNSIGCIIANDIFEHLKNPIHVMKECHRVLCDGGMLFISVPSTDGRGAWQDPTHISFWNENSFWYYTDLNFAKYIDVPVRFQNNYLKTYYPSEFHQINKITYVEAHLVALKPGGKRYPGELKI